MGGPGGPGGFDPAQFLARRDTNGNGSIDPEEMQGPARFMLDRMARTNPKIDLTKPIPLSVLTESFQQMRNGEGRGGYDEEILEPEKNSLVPGFGVKSTKAPVPGFGAAGDKFSVRIEERDLKEADNRLRSFDRNKDDGLDENELKEMRWADNPMQYDRNHDGKLSRQELATRFARRRMLKQDQEGTKRDQANAAKNRDTAKNGAEEKKEVNPFEKRSSYRVSDAEGRPVRPTGLPEWFSRDDINNDNQVSMNEFTRRWSEEALEEFSKFDTNQDGFITSKECLAGVKKGFIRGTRNDSSSSSAPSKDVAKNPSGSQAAPLNGVVADSPAFIPKKEGGVDSAMKSWAVGRMKRIDKNKDGFLSPDEAPKDLDFNKADKNGDGRIDVDEYAESRVSR